MPILRVLRGRARVFSLLLVVAVAVGCSGKKSRPQEPDVPVPPVPNSPINALALLEWCWDHRNATIYRDVFAADYVYTFAPADSQAIGVHLSRDEELAMAENLFSEGTPGHPAATSITFGLNPVLIVQNDDRPGKNGTWHKRIGTSVRLTVNTPGPDYSTVSEAVFYVTRGDSAVIPPDLVARGFTPDPARWYVDGWTDLTTCTKACVTVGDVKLDYAEGPVAAARARAARAPARP
jgi:hypothetical protein